MENKQKSQRQAGKSSMSDLVAAPLFAIVMIGVVEIASCQQVQAVTNYLASDTNSRYDVRTTKHSAAKPSRQSLAIFVPKTYLINNQQVTTGTDKNVTSINRYTYGAGHSDVSYDGTSEPNKTPLWGNKFRRLNAVVVVLFIPFFKNHPTQTNHSGGYHA
ncbi:hypothetical protein [Psychrobacter sp. 16-MNA-CIBAN-0192]|uniref:hypothetical protein n=1 Tax=Psychrobacter sp. 16-MNA-CIBAN-0192 TaxID=3140448 RepID=UPI003317EAD1